MKSFRTWLMNVLRSILLFSLRYTPTISVAKSTEDVTLCSLTSHDHLPLYLIFFKSFLFMSRRSLPILAVDDGTLNWEDITLLHRHLPGIRVVRKKDADRLIVPMLTKFHYAKRYRMDLHPAITTHNQKLFDPVLLTNTARCILIDSDVLFFSKPELIIRWIEHPSSKTLLLKYDKAFIEKSNRWGVLVFRILAKLQHTPQAAYYNTGIVCMNRTLFDLRLVEAYCKQYYSYRLAHTWLGDQPIIARLVSLLQSQKQTTISGLPSTLYVVLYQTNIRRNLSVLTCIHYHTEANKIFAFVDSLRLLYVTAFFSNVSKTI